ncbi:sugar phosphate isomerase/epimerase [Brevibacillus fluminis]|uniref:Sugar phosphate isomerase/epimerase n=1 Tax=Brevibacillus fluminis TaxID=511487 RepID=A0A3M8D969_9BACL|nr:TIM barrel protein [Brevibacillus fluminis]RNB84594.1 sugar phosphate isomerase/epimerase [Brevibacillus fluminis]
MRDHCCRQFFYPARSVRKQVNKKTKGAITLRHRLGVSGSTILSDPAHFSALFWEGIDHIEIGEFPDEPSFSTFLDMYRNQTITFGIHSPLLRTGSKYDLLESVFMDSALAWKQVEHECRMLQQLGATYLLVHFPYFKRGVPARGIELLEQGLDRLRSIQQASGLPIICEPKLGFDKSPTAIQFFHDSPLSLWADIGLCMDIGDFLLADSDSVSRCVDKWHNQIKVVHLHNVEHKDEGKYWWIPVHPSHENDGIHFQTSSLIRQLAQSPQVTFIFEHTPHNQASAAFIQEGYEWVKMLIGRTSG